MGYLGEELELRVDKGHILTNSDYKNASIIILVIRGPDCAPFQSLEVPAPCFELPLTYPMRCRTRQLKIKMVTPTAMGGNLRPCLNDGSLKNRSRDKFENMS